MVLFEYICEVLKVEHPVLSFCRAVVAEPNEPPSQLNTGSLYICPQPLKFRDRFSPEDMIQFTIRNRLFHGIKNHLDAHLGVEMVRDSIC